jgi:hypothetical protein
MYVVEGERLKQCVRETSVVSLLHITTTLFRIRVKTIGKILRNSGSVFSYFLLFSYYSVNTVIGMKMGYGVAGIGQNMFELSYRSFLD